MMALLEDSSFWAAVSFAIFVVLFGWKGWPVMAGMLDGQIQKISDSLSESRALHDEAQTLLNKKRRQKLESETMCAHIKTEASDAVRALRTQARQRWKEAGALREQQVLESIERAEAQALDQIRQHVAQRTVAVVEEVLEAAVVGATEAKYTDGQIRALAATEFRPS